MQGQQGSVRPTGHPASSDSMMIRSPCSGSTYGVGLTFAHLTAVCKGVGIAQADDDELPDPDALLSRGACCMAFMSASTSLVPGSTADVDEVDEGAIVRWREEGNSCMSETGCTSIEPRRTAYSSSRLRTAHRI